MLSQLTSTVSAAALLSLAGLSRSAAASDISTVMICTSNIYADGEFRAMLGDHAPRT